MGSKRSVSVKILDQNFMISTDASPERVKKVADFLNKTLKEAISKSKATSPYNAAVLAALNITEKYFDAVEKKTELKTRVAEKSKKVLELLEAPSRDA